MITKPSRKVLDMQLWHLRLMYMVMLRIKCGKTLPTGCKDSMIHLGVKMPVGVQLGYKGGFWHKKNPANVDLQGIKKAAPTGFEPVFQP